jgi:uncharacterized membrane protein
MNRTILASALLASVVAMSAVTANAEDMPKGKDAMVKCYGVNAVAKNDCSQGPHSCAGQATKAREGQSFVLLPAGACEKIDGGTLKPM